MTWILSNFQGSHLQPLLATRPWARDLFSLWLMSSFAKIGLMQGHLSRSVRIRGVNLCEAITTASGTCQPFPYFCKNYLIDEDT